MSIMMSKARWEQLRRVQREVNADTQYRTDLELYGKREFWAVAEGEGDCEDYALAKRRRLLKLGWPADTLRIATCWAEGARGPGTGGYHAVLVAVTDRGDFVLDNRRHWVVPWEELPYHWDKIQVAGERDWRRIEA